MLFQETKNKNFNYSDILSKLQSEGFLTKPLGPQPTEGGLELLHFRSIISFNQVNTY